MANIITCCRILCSILILYFPVYTPWFYALYIMSGFSDMLDGYVARKTNTTSNLGAKLDSISDLTFVAACLIKILPSLDLPMWLWIWIAAIAIIRVINVVSGYICQHRIVMLHTVANKATGLLLFIFPVLIIFISISYAAIPVSIVATFAAVQEGHLIRTGKL